MTSTEIVSSGHWSWPGYLLPSWQFSPDNCSEKILYQPYLLAWTEFLKISENKKPMFEFFSELICKDFKNENYLVCCTKGDKVLSNQDHSFSSLSPCNQEEADTRMFRHLYQAAEEGHRIAYIRTIDSTQSTFSLKQGFRSYGSVMASRTNIMTSPSITTVAP